MNAPEHLPVERTAIDGAQYLPLNLCKAGRYNPRKRFDEKSMAEFANNVEKFGVMQPVLARPIAGAKRGEPQYEIVAGERRFRACKIVANRRKESDIALIPAVVRELSDDDARELAVTENLHRENLHPIEEAEGFENLLMRPVEGGEFKPPRLKGYTASEIAERFDRSYEYVVTSLKLLSLIPAARDAFFDQKISKSVAIKIARMPAGVQVDATKDIVQGWAGDPLPFRQACELLERKYMLKLSSAPFKITDETLVPGAGNCKECPKRTGANPDLFGDIKSGDVCTDPACFAEKKDAHQARLIAQAKEEGREVIIGAAAKKVKPHQYGGELKGYTPLDKVEYSLPGNKTIKQHLGKDAPPIALLEDPYTHELVQVVRTDAAMQVLRDKGIVKGKLSTRSDNERRAEAKAKAETAWRTELARRAVAEVADQKYDDMDLHAWLLPEIALAMWNRLDHETTKRAVKLLGWDVVKEPEVMLRGLDARHLDQALVAMSVAGQLSVNEYSVGPNNKPTRLLQIAGRLGIDGAKVRAELAEAAAAKVKKPAAKKAAPAKAVKPLAKYRDPATLMTWSGRGLQPKWLKVALASGKTLADFDTSAPKTPESTSAASTLGEGGSPKNAKTSTSPKPEEKKKAATAKAVGKAKTKTEQKVEPAAPASKITSAAAWPFPTDPPASFLKVATAEAAAGVQS